MAIIETRDAGGMYSEIRYSEWSATYGVSDVQVAPEATVETAARGETVDAGQELRIRDDAGAKTIFEGSIVSAPRKARGNQTLKCEADVWRTFEENVTITFASPTVEEVLQAALSESATGEITDLNYQGPAITLGDDYNEQDRTVKSVFRDMADRAGVVWWVDETGEITVDERGARGTWATLDSATDRFSVREYDPDDLDAVINVQTVRGTGAELVSATATDSTSITDFGRREGNPVNVGYITSATEAQDYADELLVPDPPAGAKVIIPDGTGGETDDVLANYQIDITDPQGVDMDDTLTVERQIIEEGRMTVDLGQARARGVVEVNREAKSRGDLTSGGDEYGGDRIVDLSITETKISDDSISTPKLQTEAVTANKILANTITAALIDTLDLATDEISVGSGLDGIIEFTDFDAGTRTVTAMLPSQDNDCLVGFPGTRFAELFVREANVNDYLAADGISGGVSDDLVEVLEDHESRLDALEP